jgi:hypothetical protein
MCSFQEERSKLTGDEDGGCGNKADGNDCPFGEEALIVTKTNLGGTLFTRTTPFSHSSLRSKSHHQP